MSAALAGPFPNQCLSQDDWKLYVWSCDGYSWRYGISLDDVEETFRWLRAQSCVPMPDVVTPLTAHGVATDLVLLTAPRKSRKSVAPPILAVQWVADFWDVLTCTVWLKDFSCNTSNRILIKLCFHLDCLAWIRQVVSRTSCQCHANYTNSSGSVLQYRDRRKLAQSMVFTHIETKASHVAVALWFFMNFLEREKTQSGASPRFLQLRKTTAGQTLLGHQISTDFPVLVNPDDTEAVATAMILSSLLLVRAAAMRELQLIGHGSNIPDT